MFASLVITPQSVGLDVNPDWPYLVLYFTLGYKNGTIKNLKVVHDHNITDNQARDESITTTGDKTKKTKRQDMLLKSLVNEDAKVAKSRVDKQVIVGLFGITPHVYPFLNTNENRKHI